MTFYDSSSLDNVSLEQFFYLYNTTLLLAFISTGGMLISSAKFASSIKLAINSFTYIDALIVVRYAERSGLSFPIWCVNYLVVPCLYIYTQWDFRNRKRYSFFFLKTLQTIAKSCPHKIVDFLRIYSDGWALQLQRGAVAPLPPSGATTVNITLFDSV